LQRGFTRTANKQAERQLKHQAGTDLAAIVIRIGESSQQLAPLPSLRLSRFRLALATVIGRVGRPDRCPQQQRGVVIEARVLPIQLVSFLKRQGDKLPITERGSCLSDSHECPTSEYGSNVITSRQYPLHCAKRGSGLC
jgi:hypothetical protein